MLLRLLLTCGCALQGVRAHQAALAAEANAIDAELARDKRANVAMALANEKHMAALQGELDAALQAKYVAFRSLGLQLVKDLT